VAGRLRLRHFACTSPVAGATACLEILAELIALPCAAATLDAGSVSLLPVSTEVYFGFRLLWTEHPPKPRLSKNFAAGEWAGSRLSLNVTPRTWF
jgi:hypothetical protein